jgi:hypothetical protein
MNRMKISLKPCLACDKDYDAKLLHDGVCEKCLAAVVIKKWLRAGMPYRGCVNAVARSKRN